MHTQVITISQDGGMSGLQRKTGKGVDLRQFGRASIERVSNIAWNEYDQCWEVHIISGPMAGVLLGTDCWASAEINRLPQGCRIRNSDSMFTFNDYDDAVKAEVAFLDALRLQGIF